MYILIAFGGIMGFLCFMCQGTIMYVGVFPVELYSAKAGEFLAGQAWAWGILPGCIIGWFVDQADGYKNPFSKMKTGASAWVIVTIITWFSQPYLADILVSDQRIWPIIYMILLATFSPALVFGVCLLFWGWD